MNVWGAANGKDAVYEGTREEIEEKFLKIHSRENWLLDVDIDESVQREERVVEPTVNDESLVQQRQQQEEEENLSVKRKVEEIVVEENLDNKKIKVEDFEIKNPVEYDEDCWECKAPCRDTPRNMLVMYLHAWAYKVSFYLFKYYLKFF